MGKSDRQRGKRGRQGKAEANAARKRILADLGGPVDVANGATASGVAGALEGNDVAQILRQIASTEVSVSEAAIMMMVCHLQNASLTKSRVFVTNLLRHPEALFRSLMMPWIPSTLCKTTGMELRRKINALTGLAAILDFLHSESKVPGQQVAAGASTPMVLGVGLPKQGLIAMLASLHSCFHELRAPRISDAKASTPTSASSSASTNASVTDGPDGSDGSNGSVTANTSKQHMKERNGYICALLSFFVEDLMPLLPDVVIDLFTSTDLEFADQRIFKGKSLISTMLILAVESAADHVEIYADGKSNLSYSSLTTLLSLSQRFFDAKECPDSVCYEAHSAAARLASVPHNPSGEQDTSESPRALFFEAAHRAVAITATAYATLMKEDREGAMQESAEAFQWATNTIPSRQRVVTNASYASLLLTHHLEYATDVCTASEGSVRGDVKIDGKVADLAKSLMYLAFDMHRFIGSDPAQLIMACARAASKDLAVSKEIQAVEDAVADQQIEEKLLAVFKEALQILAAFVASMDFATASSNKGGLRGGLRVGERELAVNLAQCVNEWFDYLVADAVTGTGPAFPDVKAKLKSGDMKSGDIESRDMKFGDIKSGDMKFENSHASTKNTEDNETLNVYRVTSLLMADAIARAMPVLFSLPAELSSPSTTPLKALGSFSSLLAHCKSITFRQSHTHAHSQAQAQKEASNTVQNSAVSKRNGRKMEGVDGLAATSACLELAIACLERDIANGAPVGNKEEREEVLKRILTILNDPRFFALPPTRKNDATANEATAAADAMGDASQADAQFDAPTDAMCDDERDVEKGPTEEGAKESSEFVVDICYKNSPLEVQELLRHLIKCLGLLCRPGGVASVGALPLETRQSVAMVLQRLLDDALRFSAEQSSAFGLGLLSPAILTETGLAIISLFSDPALDAFAVEKGIVASADAASRAALESASVVTASVAAQAAKGQDGTSAEARQDDHAARFDPKALAAAFQATFAALGQWS